jgi:excisionase family DNA binding protein
MRLALDGQRFGRLLVLREAPRRADHRYWHCRCDCGTETDVGHSHLRSGGTRSCCCLLREVTATRSAARCAAQVPGYMSWRTIHLRCTNPKRHDYAAFGGSGIGVCAAWDDFATFLRDMGPRPSPRHRLIRLDEIRDFAPENCIWVTHTEHRRLRRKPQERGGATVEAAIGSNGVTDLLPVTVRHDSSADGESALDDDWLTVPQAASATGLTRSTIRHWMHNGRLPSIRINGQYAVRLADLTTVQKREHLGTVLPAWRADPPRAGQRLRVLREAAGLSQEALAAASGVTNNAISQLEHAVYAPSVESVRALAAALGIAPERFVDDRPIGLSTLTASEAAAALGVPLERVQIWLSEGQLAGTKVSGRWRVPAVAVAELERSGRLRGCSRRLDPRYRGYVSRCPRV